MHRQGPHLPHGYAGLASAALPVIELSKIPCRAEKHPLSVGCSSGSNETNQTWISMSPDGSNLLCAPILPELYPVCPPRSAYSTSGITAARRAKGRF
jgi:hypothetical protein